MRKKVFIFLITVVGSSIAADKTATDSTLNFKKIQSAKLNCEGFGIIAVSKYVHGQDFSFVRVMDSKGTSYYLPFTGGNTAHFYEDQINHLTLSVGYGDLNRVLFLEKVEWPYPGKEIKHEYKCLYLKK